MNILVVHNRYQQPGGEDIEVAQEIRLLRRNGHKVSVYERSNDELNDLTFVQRLGLVTRIISASDTKSEVRTMLRDLRPDIAHVHNTFAMVSPSVYEACEEESVPVVQTLHNYRLLCPAATLYRDHRVCEECVTHSLLRSVRYGCYRDSHVMSGALALMLEAHRSRNTWNDQIDAYIAISDFLREKFIAAGFPAAKLHVKHNFVESDPGQRVNSGDFALFVGRLTPEKGLSTLIDAWERLPSAVPLVIVGEGPMRQHLHEVVEKTNLGCIHFAGRLSREETCDTMKRASFLVVPSVWHEPFGLVIAEAFACGVPVIGSTAGAIQDMVADQVTGLHFPSGNADELAAKVTWAWNNGQSMAAMGEAARTMYEERYSALVNYKCLMNIYASTIEHHNGLKRGRAVAAA